MKTLTDLRAQFPQYDQVSDGDFLMGIHRKMYPSVHPRTFLNAIGGAENAHVTIKAPALKDWWKANVTKPMDGEAPDQAARRLGGVSMGGNDPGGRLGTAARSALQGMTFGGGDELVAAGASALGGNSYEFELNRERARLEQGREQYPGTSLAAEIGGAVLVPGLGSAGAVGQGTSLGTRVALGTAAGAASGTAYGFGSGEGGFAPRAVDAAGGALLGGAMGMAVPVVGALARKGVENVAQSRAARQVMRAASPEQMKARAQALYQQADTVTGLSRDDFSNAARVIQDGAMRGGLDADLMPGANKVMDRIVDAANDPSPTIGFRELDILRRKAAVPAQNFTNRPERALGAQMIEGIDNFVDAVDPNLSGVVKEARDLWSTLRRVEVVEGAIAKAHNTASGFENGLRVEFRKIINNPKLRQGLSPAEVAAMQQVVRGTAAGNLLRQIGRIGIGLSGQSNGLGATIGGIAGTAAGGPLGGLAAVGLGTGAKALAERSTRQAADRALGMVSSRNALAALPQVSMPGIERGMNVLGFAGVPMGSESMSPALMQAIRAAGGK